MTEENPGEWTSQALDLTVLELDQLRAQQQTSGLTTLVYGAIGASLIAALAAIVSLMQISRRIAG